MMDAGLVVSIHAPVMGATIRQSATTLVFSFNPRTRDGCDGGFIFKCSIRVVSIHAPVMGATEASPKHSLVLGVSIHAPVMGATKRCMAWQHV